MRRKHFTHGSFPLLIGLLFTINSFAQDRHLDTLYNFQPAFMSNSDVFNITGEGGFVKSNTRTGINDNVLLYPYWQNGIVNFSNGKQLRDVALKFNLLKNELYFNNNDKPNHFVDTVTSFSIFDTTNGLFKVATFSNGYPSIGRHTGKTYYLVLSSGPQAHLLKYISKKKQDMYEYGGPTKTAYTFAEELMVYDVKNNSLQNIKKSTAALEKALPAYTALIQRSLKNKSSKSLTDEEILDVIRTINNQ